MPHINLSQTVCRITSVIALFAILTERPALADRADPNFVLFIGDDISVEDFGCYGHPTIRTPNIDRLAAEGALFSNAFLTASSCSPSRCSILTGRYPHNTGARSCILFYRATQVPFTSLLRQNGYYTALAGKWHLGTNSSATNAFDRWEDTKPTGAEKWVSFLQERDKAKPFFMWFAAYDAHRGWDRPYLDPAVSRAENIGEPYTLADAVVPPYLIDDARTRRDLVMYYSEVSRFDANIGKVLDELARQGVAENTIILVMADNGRPFPRCKTVRWRRNAGHSKCLV